MSEFHSYSTDQIQKIISSQTTFDGKLLPDMAESYKIKSLVDELIERAQRLEMIEAIPEKALEKFPDYMDESHIFNKDEFINMCQIGAFIDYDGYGHYLTPDNKMYVGKPNPFVTPSEILKNGWDYRFTKILWFNR